MDVNPRKLLVAVDASPPSLQAARLAVDLAASWHAKLRAVGVLEAESSSGKRSGRDASDLEQRRAQLEDALEHVRRLGASCAVEVDVLLRDSGGARPYELILDEASRWPADLLFVGRSGRRGLGRALLGSQAEHVLEFARLPVVVVPESAAQY